MTRMADGLMALAGLMGAAGVALAALGAHGGADPRLTTAALFLLLHASAIAGLLHRTARGAPARLGFLLSAATLAAGAMLFAGDLALRALAGASPLALAAPTGGLLMIAGWLLLAGSGVVAAAQRPAA